MVVQHGVPCCAGDGLWRVDRRPGIMVFRSCCSSVVTLTSPETAATMITMTVIESISFRARRRGIICY